jgi:hypothetical protein
MARKAAYEGGAWAVGGVRQQRPPISPAVRRGLLLRYIEHAQTRIDQGVTIYEGILQEYRRELIALSVELAKARRGTTATVKDLTVETVTGKPKKVAV